MISLEDAQELILSRAKINECEYIDILDSENRILAQDVFSEIDSPPFNRSPLDGYAIKASNLNEENKEEKIFTVIDTIYAGYVSKKTVNDFQAVRIMTGARIPDGADTIVKQEDTEILEDGKVKMFVNQKPFDNFIFKGEDFKVGTLILEKGIKIKSSQAMALASLGIATIKVYKKPIVGIITTGDELLNPGEKLAGGKIYDSNKIFLKMRLSELGCNVLFFGSIADDKKSISEVISSAEKECDILISTGGVSVGEKDLVKESVEAIGYKVLFWKVDIKPGSPMFAAVNNENKIYIGLSGTPVAAATTFELTVRGLIAKMLNCNELKLQEVYGIVQDEYTKVSRKRRFLRVKLKQEKENKVYISRVYQSPGQISTMLGSNAILEVPVDKALNKGDLVKVYK